MGIKRSANLASSRGRRIVLLASLLSASSTPEREWTIRVEMMASGKKTDDENANLLIVNSVPPTVEPIAGCVDDVPDRLLILANRLQRALDSRRAAACRRAQGQKN